MFQLWQLPAGSYTDAKCWLLYSAGADQTFVSWRLQHHQQNQTNPHK